MFDWVKGNAYNTNVTLYATNITLNSAAASYFEEIRWVMIGLNRERKQLAVRAISKREVDLKLVPLDQLHKISIGKGYGRISNKAIMNEIESIMGTKVEGIKKEAVYDEKEKMLVVDLR